MVATLVIKVTEADRNLIQAAAASKRLAVSSWIRSVIVAEALGIVGDPGSPKEEQSQNA